MTSEAPEGAAGERFRALGERAAAAAHDLNNVLAAILAAADEMLARGVSDAATARDLQEIHRNAARGAALVRAFLAPQAQPDACRSSLVIGEAVLALAPLLERLLGPRVVLQIETGPPGQLVAMERADFERVLTNLATNARDALPDGGRVVVRVGPAETATSLDDDRETAASGRYVPVEVADTGIGMAPELLPVIFAPFVTTKQDSGGMGLGLASVRDLVRRAGGFVTVQSTPGEGTRFCVFLPLHTRAPAAPSPSASAGSGRTALLVEDEEAIRRLAERVLREQGWNVIAADSAEAALARLDGADADERSSPPALLIADATLPGQDGLALLAVLRGSYPGLPAILASGYISEDLRRDCAALGVAFLAKPYALSALIATTEAVMCQPASE